MEFTLLDLQDTRLLDVVENERRKKRLHAPAEIGLGCFDHRCHRRLVAGRENRRAIPVPLTSWARPARSRSRHRRIRRSKL